MLKTRITEQYGLKVPFINAGMAFVATTPLVLSVCKAGGMGMLGAAAMPPEVLQAALRETQSSRPCMLRGQFHCAVQRHRTHRGVRQGKGAGCCVLLG